MKRTKRIFAIFMTMALAMSMLIVSSAVSFAADPTTYAITVNTDNDAVTHTYKVYQIYTGTPDGNKLTDIKYGSSYPQKTAGAAVPKTELDAIGTTSDSVRAWLVNQFAGSDGKLVLGAEVATLNATTTSYDAVPGYYLVLDTEYTPTDTTKDAYSAYMVKVVDAATEFTPKKNVPSVDKQVKDEVADKEATADDNGWGETADHEIGETFQFKLKATIPADANLKTYKTYMVKFNDTMSDGVTFEKINSVKVNGTSIAATAYTCNAEEGQAGGSWNLTIADIKKIDGVSLGEAPIEIEVEYDAHLNTAAAVNTASGPTTNENKVSLTYSNNPDATGAGETDTTPEDHVWVFTYASNNTKVDKNNNPVAGAGFTLKDSTGAAINLYKVGTTYYKYDSTKTDYPEGGEVVTEMITTADTGKFDIKGLDVGTYTLTETTVPSGYVQCEDISISISAVHAETTNEETGAETPNVTLTQSNLSNTVVNDTGATLPSTGGIGTIIFYVLGSLLVVGCGIVLISKRRMESR